MKKNLLFSCILAGIAGVVGFAGLANAAQLSVHDPGIQVHEASATTSIFAADSVYHDYQRAQHSSAGIDWVVTFPTKTFHVDPVGDVLRGSATAREYTSQPRPDLPEVFTPAIVDATAMHERMRFGDKEISWHIWRERYGKTGPYFDVVNMKSPLTT